MVFSLCFVTTEIVISSDFFHYYSKNSDPWICAGDIRDTVVSPLHVVQRQEVGRTSSTVRSSTSSTGGHLTGSGPFTTGSPPEVGWTLGYGPEVNLAQRSADRKWPYPTGSRTDFGYFPEVDLIPRPDVTGVTLPPDDGRSLCPDLGGHRLRRVELLLTSCRFSGCRTGSVLEPEVWRSPEDRGPSPEVERTSTPVLTGVVKQRLVILLLLQPHHRDGRGTSLSRPGGLVDQSSANRK